MIRNAPPTPTLNKPKDWADLTSEKYFINVMEKEAEYKTKPTEISCKQVSHKDFEITTTTPDLIILHDTHLEFKTNYKYKKTEDGIPTEGKFIGNSVFIKNFIAEIHVSWSIEKEIYELEVFTTRIGNTITTFETFAEALEVKNKIMDWLIK